jgi:putrescine aminotransferase
METLPFYNSFFNTTNVPAVQLAAKLAQISPPQFNHVYFTGSGSEGNDTNVRMVRRYWDVLGYKERHTIISRHNAYHGSTMAGASLGGMKACTRRAACRFRASCISASRTIWNPAKA